MKNKIMKTHWPVHPMAELFPLLTPDERKKLKDNMQDRVANGLDPLENSILLWLGSILDGRHRDELWMELAEEKACGGFFARNRPPTEEYSPEKHGTLGAWLRVQSRNLVVRQTPADQRAAIFLQAVETYPELKAAVDEIKEENLKKKQKGKPLDAGGQRGNTAKQIGELAGVGPTTVKQVKKLKKEAPDQFEKVAKGKITAKKAIKEIKERKQKVSAKAKPSATPPKPGDTIYQIESYRPDVAGSPRLLKLTVKEVKKGLLVCGRKRVPISEALTLEAAQQERKDRIKRLIADLQKALSTDGPIVSG